MSGESSDSDETLPPSDLDQRHCYSPDLFDGDTFPCGIKLLSFN